MINIRIYYTLFFPQLQASACQVRMF